MSFIMAVILSFFLYSWAGNYYRLLYVTFKRNVPIRELGKLCFLSGQYACAISSIFSRSVGSRYDERLHACIAAHYQYVNPRDTIQSPMRHQSLSTRGIICLRTAISARFPANFDFSSSRTWLKPDGRAVCVSKVIPSLAQRNRSWIISRLPN